ncbi:MAG: DUF3048 domain-containing protein [Defluviitaleaceae bacterium]|nr:DUF3048 domain-containing protein [Defluviitaleaceae bacterium]
MKKLSLTIAAFLIALSITACQSPALQEAPEMEIVEAVSVEITAPADEPEEIPDTGPDLTGLSMNPLTGHYIDEELAVRRPIAIVINNIGQALPQSGIAEADIIYEVLAEGGITRLVAIYKELSSEKIGPVRSMRHYFLDFAFNHDAIFVHHGGSPQGYAAINSLRVNNLDGMHIARAFFRDPERAAIPRMIEHSSYARASGLFEEIELRGLRTELQEDFTLPFLFFDDDDVIEGNEYHEVIVNFAPGSQVGLFEYVPDARIYLRSQNGNPQIDEYTGQQLVVENVIIQYVSMRVIDGEGRRDVNLVGEGRGTLHTRGVAIPIRWSKASHEAPTIWTFENGEPMRISRGKTWICIIAE